MKMSENFENKKYKKENYFNSKLYFDLGKYKNDKQENFDNIERIENNQNGKYLTQCLSKDLLDTIDCFLENEPEKKDNIQLNDYSTFIFDETADSSIINNNLKNDSFDNNNYSNSNVINKLIPLINQKYTFTPKNFQNKNNGKNKKKIVGRKGDWICNFCNNLNYSFRKICNRCHANKETSDLKSFKFYGKK